MSTFKNHHGVLHLKFYLFYQLMIIDTIEKAYHPSDLLSIEVAIVLAEEIKNFEN